MAEQNNVVLIGMPGAGKSTLGVVLAKIMNYRFLDTDLTIQETFGATLQELIDQRGPLGFIELENQVLKSVNPQRTIISTGGSAVYSDEAMEHLRSIGRVVYLKIGCDELKKRLGDLHERGVVMKDGMGDNLELLFAERLPLYEKWADLTVEVQEMSITDAVRALAAALGAK